MYILKSGDKNSQNILKGITLENPRVKDILANASGEDIIDAIFSGAPNQADKITTLIGLVYGGSFNPRISEELAKIMFFIYCVNYEREDLTPELRITTMYKAKLLFKAYEGDYTKYEEHSIKETQRYTTLRWDANLSFDSFIEFKIPVGFFSSGGGQYVCLSANTPMVLILNEEDEFLIPRKQYISMFKLPPKSKGKAVASSTDELKEMFNIEDIGKIAEILTIAGCEELTEISQDDLPDGVLSIKNSKLVFENCDILDDEKYNRLLELKWKPINDTDFVLLPEFRYIIWGDYEKNGRAKLLSY